MIPISFVSLWMLAWVAARLDGAAVRQTEPGLYGDEDRVVVLDAENFDRLVYGQKHAWLLQFYNSQCGHCRYLAPKFKVFARSVYDWRDIVTIGVVNCFQLQNNNICRAYEIMGYPTLRYLHENFVKANSINGEKVEMGSDPEHTTIENLISRMKTEQSEGRLAHAPPLDTKHYKSLTEVTTDAPPSAKYAFLIFDDAKSKLGPLVAMDTHDYNSIAVRSVASDSELASKQGLDRFPALLAIHDDVKVANLTPRMSNRSTIVHAINVFLESKHVTLPVRNNSLFFNVSTIKSEHRHSKDEVRLDDLETALDMTLEMEITRHKVTDEEAVAALKDFLSVLIDYFPFRANGKAFLLDLKQRLDLYRVVEGAVIQTWVRELKEAHRPVFSSPLKYVQCRGSSQLYRGHPCGLWTIFHTLTATAATQRAGNAPDVLHAMHGYVKHFFACTECSQHFQQMAAKNNMSLVRGNDKAVLWLWIAHNEVNLRLAGDATEDPEFPKVQYPIAENCRDCRDDLGAWRLPQVYRYLLTKYASTGIHSDVQESSSASPLSPLDFTITAFLYIFSFFILLFVCKLLFAKTSRYLLSARYTYKRHPYSK